MGKSAKFKKLRKIAANLPELSVNRKQGVKIDGEKLLAQGIKTTADGKPIDTNLQYVSQQTVQQPANYNKFLKDRYNKGGIDLALQFASQVIQRAQELRKQQEQPSVK